MPDKSLKKASYLRILWGMDSKGAFGPIIATGNDVSFLCLFPTICKYFRDWGLHSSQQCQGTFLCPTSLKALSVRSSFPQMLDRGNESHVASRRSHFVSQALPHMLSVSHCLWPCPKRNHVLQMYRTVKLGRLDSRCYLPFSATLSAGVRSHYMGKDGTSVNERQTLRLCIRGDETVISPEATVRQSTSSSLHSPR